MPSEFRSGQRQFSICLLESDTLEDGCRELGSGLFRVVVLGDEVVTKNLNRSRATELKRPWEDRFAN